VVAGFKEGSINVQDCSSRKAAGLQQRCGGVVANRTSEMAELKQGSSKV
jgi:hypothetical protein